MSAAGDGLMTDSEWAQFAATKLSGLSRQAPSQSPAALGTLTPPESSPAVSAPGPAASSVVVRHMFEVALLPEDTTRSDDTWSDKSGGTECPPSPPRKPPRRRTIPIEYTCKTCRNCEDMVRNGGTGKRKRGCMNPDPAWALAQSWNIAWDGKNWVCGPI